MIIGIVIRNFKVYKNINYVPLSNGTNFCGLIGQNGIGKSSILEALDCFFNSKGWNRNLDANKSEQSYITPVFLLDADFFDRCDCKEFAIRYSDTVKKFLEKEISSTVQLVRKQCFESLKDNLKNIDISDKYLIPVGIDEGKSVGFKLFGENEILDELQPLESLPKYLLDSDTTDPIRTNTEEQHREARLHTLEQQLLLVYETIVNTITYVYVPKDIEPERFVKFETEEIQHLMGTSLVDIVKKHLSETQIKQISTKLQQFVDELSSKLPNYTFKIKGRERQIHLKAKDIYDLIIEDFFTKRDLHKDNPGKDIPLVNLSSGEKQQAIISLIYGIINNYRNDNKRLIVAIDEPESALHISLCYEQFEKLYDISTQCCQVLFSSHWYGFIPTITRGTIVNIIEQEDKHVGYLLDIARYKEEIKIADRAEHGKLPIEITLKGINDLIQSIISSVISDNCYSWLICEGSSDKIYLEEYLKEEMERAKLRIVPVGGSGEVKKIYQQLLLAFDDLKSNVKGKVFLLVDTDTQFHSFETKPTRSLLCKRIVNNTDSRQTLLVDNNSNPIFPTDIEDALNGKAFFNTLKQFDDANLGFIDSYKEEIAECPSYFALDLRDSERNRLDLFFSNNNNRNKVIFANKYVEEIRKQEYLIPAWINQIKEYFSDVEEDSAL